MKKMAIIVGSLFAFSAFLFASFLMGPALLCGVQTIITKTFLNETPACWGLL